MSPARVLPRPTLQDYVIANKRETRQGRHARPPSCIRPTTNTATRALQSRSASDPEKQATLLTSQCWRGLHQRWRGTNCRLEESFVGILPTPTTTTAIWKLRIPNHPDYVLTHTPSHAHAVCRRVRASALQQWPPRAPEAALASAPPPLGFAPPAPTARRTTDQSDAGSVGMFSRRTNQTQEAW
eukprot:615430-Prorocentrum_minimum.AAC.3